MGVIPIDEPPLSSLCFIFRFFCDPRPPRKRVVAPLIQCLVLYPHCRLLHGIIPPLSRIPACSPASHLVWLPPCGPRHLTRFVFRQMRHSSVALSALMKTVCRELLLGFTLPLSFSGLCFRPLLVFATLYPGTACPVFSSSIVVHRGTTPYSPMSHPHLARLG